MYLYGASGHAKVIIDILELMNIEVSGLFDDNKEVAELLGFPVYHEMKKNIDLIVSIGNNEIRKRVVEKLFDINYIKAIHSSAIISKRSTIDIGTVVMQGAIVQSATVVGKHCIINTGASVDHDCVVEDFVHLSPQSILCGNVHVGEGAWIGAGTTIIPGVKIGKWAVVGAGSVVTKNIPDYALAAGNRCKVLKIHTPPRL